ncbi:MAG TPA: hypothetical protein VLG74_00950, partial [Blastocatellia bacterium]|nr:hypothetical protein [Blastocatellia bacterium]
PSRSPEIFEFSHEQRHARLRRCSPRSKEQGFVKGGITGLFRGRWLIRKAVFRSSLAFNPDVATTGAVPVQMTPGSQYERRDADKALGSAMGTYAFG